MRMRRSTLLNRIIRAYGYKSYLEIGCFKGHTLNAVECESKTSVEPFPRCEVTHKMTSDDFFSQNKDVFDLVFVDGDHTYEQTYRDVVNALGCLRPGGTVVMHDCLPAMEVKPYGRRGKKVYWQSWRAFARLRAERTDLNMLTVNTDQGCGIVTAGCQQLISLPDPFTFEYFMKNRTMIMNIVSVRHYLRRLELIKGG